MTADFHGRLALMVGTLAEAEAGARRVIGRFVLAGVLMLAWSAFGTSAATALTWSTPRPVDGAVPFGHIAGLSEVSCVSARWCVAIDGEGRVAASTNPTGGASAWTAVVVDAYPLRAVTCPSESLCVGLDTNGDVVTSTEPMGGVGAWTTASVDFGHQLLSISCPSAQLCVAADDSGDVVVSTNPTGGESAWSTPTSIDPSGAIRALSCPTVSLCAAVDALGGVVTSTDPAGGSSSWTRVDADGGNVLAGVSCASALLCVAIDQSGNVVTSTDPSGGSSAWTASLVDASSQLYAVSCPSPGLCVAFDGRGDVLTSTNPAGGPAAWSAPVNVDASANVDAVSCPSTVFCAAGDGSGNVLTTTEPTDGASTWQLSVAESGADALGPMACPSASLCVGFDDAGRLVTSTDPAGAAPTWTVSSNAPLHDDWEFQLSCPSASLCVGFGLAKAIYGTGALHSATLVTSSNPGGRPDTWKRSTPFGLVNAAGLSCATVNLCVAIAFGGVVTSPHPTVADSWTQPNDIGGDQLSHIACDREPLCVVTDYAGDVITSTNPGGGSRAWKTSYIDPSHPTANGVGTQSSLYSVSCTAAALCATVDNGGNVLTSTDPAGGAGAWKLVHLNLGYSLGQIACPAISLCVALGVDGEIVTSTDPTGAASSWTATPIDPGAELTSLSCPSVSLCVAADDTGNVVVGTGPNPPTVTGPRPQGVTRKAALAALTGALRNSCVRERIPGIRRRGGCRTPFTAPGKGTVTITWLSARGRKQAAGHARATRRRKLVVRVALTKTGRQYLRHARRPIHIRVKATFSDDAGNRYTKTAHLTLRA